MTNPQNPLPAYVRGFNIRTGYHREPVRMAPDGTAVCVYQEWKGPSGPYYRQVDLDGTNIRAISRTLYEQLVTYPRVGERA